MNIFKVIEMSLADPAKYAAIISGMFIATAALLTLIVNHGMTLFYDWRKNRREERGLANSYYGNIKALMAIEKSKALIAFVEQFITNLQNAPQVINPKINLVMDQNYLELFNRTNEKLGKLSYKLPEKISEFYTRINSIVEDTKMLNDITYLATISNLDHIRHCEQFLGFAKGTLYLGNDILKIIKKKYQ
jgi:hypothetical protein